MRQLAAQPVKPYRLSDVNSGSFCQFGISVRGVDGIPFTPTTLQYRLDDLLTGNELVPWTAATPAAETIVTIPASVNVMQRQWNDMEPKQLTLYATNEDGNQGTQVFVYNLINLYMTTSPA